MARMTDQQHEGTIAANSMDSPLLALPRLVLGQLLRHVDLRDQLRSAVCCKYLHDVVSQDLLPWVHDLDLLQCTGTQTTAALEWLCSCSWTQNLHHLAVQGAVCSDACTCLSETGLGRQHLGRLHSLVLQGWRRLDTVRLKQLMVHCRSLTSLEFSNCKVDDAGLAVLATHVPTLQHLNCSHCLRVTDDGILKLLLGAKQLKGLVLDGLIHCTDQTPALLAMHAANLEHLSLSKCLKIHNEGVKALASAPGPEGVSGSSLLGSVPLLADTLRSLCLSWCPKVSVVEPLARLRRLESLDLTGCKDVPDAQLLAAVSGSTQYMRRVYLHGCVALTGEGIVALASACPHLQVLSLRNVQLQDQHLHQLALSTGHLTELGLGMCHAITDAGIRPLLLANTNLERLELDGCYMLGDATVRLLPFSAPRLTYLHLRLCNLVTAGALLELVRGPPIDMVAVDANPSEPTKLCTGSSSAPSASGRSPGKSREAAVDAERTREQQVETCGVAAAKVNPGCRHLLNMRLGGVLSEQETTLLARQLKVARPGIVLRV